MTEKQTFKNPGVQWKYDPLMRKYGWLIEEYPFFFVDEWDAEIIFTKKQKPLEVGQWVRVHDCGEAILAKILHIRGDFLWVSDDPDGVVDGNPSEGWIEHIANVKIPD